MFHSPSRHPTRKTLIGDLGAGNQFVDVYLAFREHSIDLGNFRQGLFIAQACLARDCKCSQQVVTEKGNQVAIYTTFFVCHPEELAAGFPGWLPPLLQPVKRKVTNPFTGEEITIESSSPEWPEEENAGVANRQHQVVALSGKYQDYLEGRLPSLILREPHWASKGLTEVELGPLVESLGLEAAFSSPLFAPPSLGIMLQEFPIGVIGKLASLDQQAQQQIAEDWAAAMSTPEYTHSASDKRISENWDAAEAIQILQPLIQLAREAGPDRRMFLLVEA